MKTPAENSGKVKTLIYDIETAYNVGAYFGRGYEANIAKVIQKGYVLGFAYKFLDEKKIHTCYIWDFPLYKKDPKNDINVIKKWIELVEQTHILVGWNSDRFDNRVMYGRLLIHKLPPLAMPQNFDVMKAVKRLAAFDSYKLDDVSESLGHGNKLKTDIDLWVDCIMGDKKAQKRMVRYNKRDVQVTELDYIDIAPHSKQHPNVANISNQPDVCKWCGENEGFVSNGNDYTKTGTYKRWQCKNCRGNNRSQKGEKNEKPRYV